ncbi:MAG: condensation domain-containing protein [Bacteroidota bacterium]
MSTATKAKIEDIYPLSFMQEALLLHHIYQKEDQGIIEVRCRLKGPLDESLFQQAWTQVLIRHQALRSSIHWEKVDKPVQVVRPSAEIIWNEEGVGKDLNLNRSPVGNWRLTPLEDQLYDFHWQSHHILLDGWSSGIVLADVFAIYDALVKGEELRLPTIPTYRNYLNWLKTKEVEPAEIYWRQRLNGVKPSLLLKAEVEQSSINFQDSSYQFPEATTLKIQEFCRNQRLTLNSLFQGLWGLLLSEHFQQKDVIFGTTIAGRSSEVPMLDQIAGLFTQILPVRLQIPRDQSLGEWLREVQNVLQNDNGFAYAGTDSILSWMESSNGKTPFNTLLIVQNYPWDDLSGGGVEVIDYQGDLTTTYPLTAICLPGKQLKWILRYQFQVIQPALIDWFDQSITKLIETVLTSEQLSLQEVVSSISSSPVDPKASNKVKKSPALDDFQVPNGSTELQLVKIWENLLGQSPISANADFFQLGGTSLLAIRLFTQIRQTFGKHFPPISLLQNRSIQQLANLIADEQEVQWKTVVPLRASGNKTPIFCFHAGMGHVFFYHPLATALENRPVFAIQPAGLDGEGEVHGSIEEMAASYLTEIQKIQPKGPYIFLAYCYSTAIVVELAKILQEVKQPPPITLVVDSGPSETELNRSTTYKTGRKSLRWYLSSIRKGKFKRAYNELLIRVLPGQLLGSRLNTEKQVQELRDQLLPAYNRYIWPQFQGDIALFISEERTSFQETMKRLDLWKILAQGDVKKYIVPGEHIHLFDAERVHHLAVKIENHLTEVEA